MLISIIVLNFNRLSLSQQTIERLLISTTLPAEWIFIDNGSIDGTREYLTEVAKRIKEERNEVVKLIFTERNLGCAGGRNRAIKETEGEYIIIFDNDIIVEKGYDRELVDGFKIDKVALMAVNVEKKKYPIKEINGIKIRWKMGNLGAGVTCFHREKTLEMFGYFATFGSLYGMEEVDYTNRVTIAGYNAYYTLTPGRHIGITDSPQLRNYKKSIHNLNSKMFAKMAVRKRMYKKTKKFYVPYNEPPITIKDNMSKFYNVKDKK